MKPKFTVRQEGDGVGHIVRFLDHEIFGPEVPMGKTEVDDATWWIARNAEQDVVGFGGARYLEDQGLLLLVRCGVLRKARGNKLQRRFLDVRTRWGKRQGAKSVITYTLHDNEASVNNLIRAGFITYEPEWAWVGRDNVLYWWKDL
jgi:hypothetical protein